MNTDEELTTTRLARPVLYRVEVSARPVLKSEYVIKHTTHSLERARLFYTSINIGKGFKKRLVAHSEEFGTTKTIERQFS